MRYSIIFSPEAFDDLRDLRANLRGVVKDAIETYLRHSPTQTSRSRIKRLRGLTRPQYRLRIEDIRVYYDVIDDTVEILAIISKSEADKWLDKVGEK